MDDSSVAIRLTEAQKARAADPELIELAHRLARHHARRHPHLYEEYVSAAMYGLCLAAMGSCDPRAWHAYVGQAITHQIINTYKADRPKGCRQSRRRIPLRYDLDSINEPSIETEPGQPEPPPDFDDLIAPLPPLQREICRCVYEKGLFFQAAAEVLGITVNQVRRGHEEAIARLSGAWQERTEMGQAIRAARVRAGLSGQELAKRLGKSPSYVLTIERGERMPTPVIQQLIRQILGDLRPAP
jgi:RNA polymerase sigma factor (sigma-70 family)